MYVWMDGCGMYTSMNLWVCMDGCVCLSRGICVYVCMYVGMNVYVYPEGSVCMYVGMDVYICQEGSVCM